MKTIIRISYSLVLVSTLFITGCSKPGITKERAQKTLNRFLGSDGTATVNYVHELPQYSTAEASINIHEFRTENGVITGEGSLKFIKDNSGQWILTQFMPSMGSHKWSPNLNVE